MVEKSLAFVQAQKCFVTCFFLLVFLGVVLFWLDVSLFFPAVVFWLFCLQSCQPARLTVLTYACAASCLLRFLKSGFLGGKMRLSVICRLEGRFMH